MEELPEITKARKLKDFFVEWGMNERDAKKTALQIVFQINEIADIDNPDFTSREESKKMAKSLFALAGNLNER